MDCNTTRIKFAILWSLDASKGILFIIAFIVAFKVLMDPGNDPLSVILWRLAEVSIIIVPAVIILFFIYGLINHEQIVAYDKEAEDKKNIK